MKSTSAVLAAVLLSSCGALAAITIDGTRDAGYGAALSVQTVETGFGDNFSELNAGYATIQGGNLHLMLTGNLENNFNKLNVFIDSKVGGQNQLSLINPGNDNWANKHNGFRFDAAFSADYMFILRNGGTQFDLDYAQVGGGATSFDAYGNVFGGSTQGSATTGAGANLGYAFGIAFNNSNGAGVVGGSAAANQAAALAVTTGIELSIPLSALGNPGLGDTIRISAMVNGSNHDYLSNQFLDGLAAPQGNLGGDGFGGYNGTVSAIDLNNYGGDQFFVITVPEPSTIMLLAVGSLVFFARVCRRDEKCGR